MTKRYNCPNPDCNVKLNCWIPTRKDISQNSYEATVQCSNCLKYHFKKVHPNKLITAQLIAYTMNTSIQEKYNPDIL